MAGGKSRKTGTVSKQLIARLKLEKIERGDMKPNPKPLPGGGPVTDMFEIASATGQLPATVEELGTMAFFGQKAVTFYRDRLASLDQLSSQWDRPIALERQRRAALADGQRLARMLLDVEARIGGLLPPAREMSRAGGRAHKGFPAGKPIPAVLPPGITSKHAYQARQIHAHPDLVQRVINRAEAFEDIPTKHAVLNRIRAELKREADRVVAAEEAAEAERRAAEERSAISPRQRVMIGVLRRMYDLVGAQLLKDPPADWCPEGRALARPLIYRIIRLVDGACPLANDDGSAAPPAADAEPVEEEDENREAAVIREAAERARSARARFAGWSADVIATLETLRVLLKYRVGVWGPAEWDEESQPAARAIVEEVQATLDNLCPVAKE